MCRVGAGGHLGQALTEPAAGDQGRGADAAVPLRGWEVLPPMERGEARNHANRGINLDDSSRSSPPRKSSPRQGTSSCPQIIHKVASTDFVYGFFVPWLPGQSLCPLDVRALGREAGSCRKGIKREVFRIKHEASARGIKPAQSSIN